jgi:hypothetical protein
MNGMFSFKIWPSLLLKQTWSIMRAWCWRGHSKVHVLGMSYQKACQYGLENDKVYIRLYTDC